MMRSLYSGISGLRNHQTRMDVIGNNIANVNTAGFKASRVVFQDIFSQNIAGGSASNGAMGGTNGMQIGLGMRTSSIDVMHTRSAFQRTDNPLDMMINGDGFFMVSRWNEETEEYETLFTRAGNFNIDSDGYLVNSQGFFVLGFEIDEDGDRSDVLGRINVQDPGFTISEDGEISVMRENRREVTHVIGISVFRNPEGLERAGNSLFMQTAASGDAIVGAPDENGAGKIMPSGLEMSNVDLSDQFTDMIVTQRGFQANSRIITVSDTMLEELVNLKR